MCKSSMTNKGIKLLSFNVEGLASELEDVCFLELLNGHDICLLNETWRTENSKLDLPGFWDFSVVKSKRTKRGRPSGGLTIFCKENIRKGVKIDSFTEGIIWLKLDRTFFNLPNHLFIGAVYIYLQSIIVVVLLKLIIIKNSLLPYQNT